jgi:hypothetical protein
MPGVWSQDEGGEWGAGTRQEFRTCQLLRDFLARTCPTCPVTKPGESYRFSCVDTSEEKRIFVSSLLREYFFSLPKQRTVLLFMVIFLTKQKKLMLCQMFIWFFLLDLVRKLPSHARTLQWLKQKVFYFAFVTFFSFSFSKQWTVLSYCIYCCKYDLDNYKPRKKIKLCHMSNLNFFWYFVRNSPRLKPLMEWEVHLYVEFRVNVTWLRRVVLLVTILVDKFTFVLCIFLPIHAISNQIYF